MSVEALARVLLDYRRTITDTDQVKAIDLHQAQQMLADPAPLLAALAECGVLTTMPCCGPVRCRHEVREFRYVSDWTEAP